MKFCPFLFPVSYWNFLLLLMTVVGENRKNLPATEREIEKLRDCVQLLVLPKMSVTGLFSTFRSDCKKMFAFFGPECISLARSLGLHVLLQC